MKTANFVHVVIGIILGVLGVFSLCLGCSLWPTAILIGLVNLYVVVLLIVQAIAGLHGKCKGFIPDRTWSLLLVASLAVTTITAFANLYIQSQGVIHTIPDKSSATSTNTTVLYETLTNHTDAVYFSTVTITTLGYGDFAPGTREARTFVIWELATGLLVLLGIYPLLLSRLADFKPRPSEQIETLTALKAKGKLTAAEIEAVKKAFP